MAIECWTPSFNSSNDCFGRPVVWIRFKGLNMMYYEESAIKTIVTVIGKPIRVGFVAKEMGRGKFARVCVEVDLSKLVVRKVWIEDQWHGVGFESFHLIYENCGCYGHVTRSC